MHKWFTRIGLLLIAAIAVTTAHAQAGVTPVNPPQPVDNDGKVEVLEVFAYGCIHCAELESPFEAWRKKQAADVKIKRIPTPAPIMACSWKIACAIWSPPGRLRATSSPPYPGSPRAIRALAIGR